MESKTVKKRRKYSKNSKKNLRKYTDIRDVEEFLEEQRFQERTGGLVVDKVDDELFFIQKEKAVDDTKTVGPRRRKRPLRGKKSSSGSVGDEGISARCRAILGVVDSSEDEQEYDVGLRYADQRRRERRELAVAVSRRLKKSRIKPPTRDLWADSEEVSHKDIPDEHFLRVTRKLPVKKPSSVGAKPSALDNVHIPPPGASYNPAFDDHQDLLRSAVEVEVQKVASEEKLNKRLQQMSPMTASQRDQVWQDEMMEGLIDSEGEGEGSGSDDEMPPNKRPVLAENKKTLQQRRRQRERREKERQRQELKQIKTQMNDVYRLRSLKREIAGEEAAITRKVKRREELQKEELYHTKRLGRRPYVAPDIDVQLSSEISGALRSLKPEGSIAVDRFKSFEQRNMIEPRNPVRKRRKYKLKMKEKRSARLPDETGDSQK